VRIEALGDVHAVDPLAVLPSARRAANVADSVPLVSIDARYVDGSGHVDPSAKTYRGSIEYKFGDASSSPPRDPDTPIGVPAPRPLRVTIATVTVDQQGFRVTTEQRVDLKPRTPGPRCDFARV
jgi:hypothetical protein